MMRRTARGVAMALVTGLVMVGAACGGDDGGSSSSFCDTVEDAQADFAELDTLDTTGAGFEEAFTKADDAFAEMADNAPDEIKDDMQLLAGAMSDLITVFEDADWDFAALVSDPEAAAKLEVLDSEEYQTASDNVAQYAKDECGVDLEGGTSSTDGPSSDDTAADSSSDSLDIPADGTPTEQLAAVYAQTFGLSEEKATCLAEAFMEAGGDAASTPDPSQIMSLLEDCDISVDELTG